MFYESAFVLVVTNNGEVCAVHVFHDRNAARDEMKFEWNDSLTEAVAGIPENSVAGKIDSDTAWIRYGEEDYRWVIEEDQYYEFNNT